jgi:hypothetical protein
MGVKRGGVLPERVGTARRQAKRNTDATRLQSHSVLDNAMRAGRSE